MFSSVGIFRTSSLGDSISSNPERTAPRRQGGKPDFIELLQQRTGSPNFKRLLLIKENQISQIKEFSTFLCMGRCKSLGSLKSFPWSAPLLSGAGVLCFHILSFLGAHPREWLQSDGCWMAGVLSFLSSLRAHQLPVSGGYNCWWLWHPLFTDMAGNIPFLICQLVILLFQATHVFLCWWAWHKNFN